MNVITIESDAFRQIMDKLKSIETEFIEAKPGQGKRLEVEWLDNQDVSMLLKISKRTLQTYRDTGVLSYSQIGHKVYYKAKDIEKFLKSNYFRAKNQ